MQRFAGLAVILAACGGSVDLTDAPTGDGSLVDAPLDGTPTDAEIDAPPAAPFSGTFSVVETETMMPGVALASGQGPEVRIVFVDATMLPPPSMQEQAGPMGCKVWEYDPAQAAHASVGIDEGAVTLTFAGPGAPVMPTCSFRAGQGYSCQDVTTMSTGGVIAPGAMNTWTFDDADVTYTTTNSLGRFLRITGAANSANDGLFPILDVLSPRKIVYANPSASAEVLPGGASHVNIAGVGAIPRAADPGFLADSVALTVNHVAGGALHVPAFTVMTTGPGHLGDDFTLDNASMALLTHIPRDGQAMMFTCVTGCDAAQAELSSIELVSTDAPTAGLPPLALPLPVTRQVRVRCSAPATNPLVVPASYAAKLMSPAITRIRATFTRGTVVTWPDPPVTGIAGHAITAATSF